MRAHRATKNVPKRVREQIINEARAAAAEFKTPLARRKEYVRTYSRLYAKYMTAHSATWRAARAATAVKSEAKREVAA